MGAGALVMVRCLNRDREKRDFTSPPQWAIMRSCGARSGKLVAEMRAVPGSHQRVCGAQALLEIGGEFAGSLPFPSESTAQALLLLRGKERGKQFFSGTDQKGRTAHGGTEYSIHMATISFVCCFLASISAKNKV